ncbi:MAG: hypothetical protein A2488_00715 [Candidatus Magasanikbacteria bacterium RIFOXYC12_FULL_32_21b]|nr:MAG: hypothetical protein A2488_00715 [Candidatus Magasanikbacteria bacterium RIFOXYC12_FULL_32_21b]
MEDIERSVLDTQDLKLKSDSEIKREANRIFSLDNIYKNLDYFFTSSDEEDKKNVKFILGKLCEKVLFLYDTQFGPIFEKLAGQKSNIFDSKNKNDIESLEKINKDYESWSSDGIKKLLVELNSLRAQIKEMVDRNFSEDSSLIVDYLSSRVKKKDRESEKIVDGVFVFEMLRGKTREETLAFLQEKLREMESLIGFGEKNFIVQRDVDFFKKTVEDRIMQIKGALNLLEVLD